MEKRLFGLRFWVAMIVGVPLITVGMKREVGHGYGWGNHAFVYAGILLFVVVACAPGRDARRSGRWRR